MHEAGTASWRFADDIPTIPHALLYLLDALRLEELQSFEVPRLIGEVPDRRPFLTASERSDAAGAWSGWWTRAVEAEV